MPDGATLARARQLVSQLNYHAAQQILRDTMGRARQDPGKADPIEAEGAVLYAGVLLQLADATAAGNWASYAYAAMRRLHGERDHRTLHSLGVLAVTQHRAGALDLASRHYQQLVAALSAVEGPDSERTMAARADGAGVDHALGRCSEARAMLGQVIEAHKLRHGPGHPVGIRMTARLAAMWRDCGDYERARDLVAQARAQAAALPPDDETHRLLDAASRATANKKHRCGLATAPAVVVPRPGDLLPPRPNGTFTPHITEWPEDDVADAAAPDNLPPPAPPPPALLAPPPPPLLLRQAPMAPPPKPKRPRNPARRKALGAIALGAVAATAVALVAFAMLASGTPEKPADASASEQPAAVTPSAAPAAAEPSGPVANLRLVDNGNNVSVSWVYPANAKGPIIISAAVAGEPMRPMQSLPAGTENYILPGLNPDRDYCVTVAVAYNTDHVVMASPVCTNRKKT